MSCRGLCPGSMPRLIFSVTSSELIHTHTRIHDATADKKSHTHIRAHMREHTHTHTRKKYYSPSSAGSHQKNITKTRSVCVCQCLYVPTTVSLVGILFILLSDSKPFTPDQTKQHCVHNNIKWI